MISLLKKSGVALFVLALALVAQIPHAAHVFDRAPYIGLAVQPDSALAAWLLAYAYAIALESATLMFVVHGHQRASYGFALASFAVNLSYYAMHKVNLWSAGALPAWLLAALLPIAIASYSHILTGSQDVQVQVPAWALRAWEKWRNQPVALPSVVEVQALETQTQTQVEVVSPNDHYLRPSHDVAQPDPSIDATMQVDAIDTPLALTELDEMNARIIVSIRNGNYTPYAISKDTGIAQTTLKRKQGDGYGGRLSQLCAMGMIHNSSGADGSEYRLNEGT